MSINIITADQPLTVGAIITYIYADPGLSKTSIGFTGDKAISFDFDKVRIVLVSCVAVLWFR